MDYIFIVLSGLEKSFINFDSKKIWVKKKQIETYNISAQESRSLNKKKAWDSNSSPSGQAVLTS